MVWHVFLPHYTALCKRSGHIVITDETKIQTGVFTAPCNKTIKTPVGVATWIAPHLRYTTPFSLERDCFISR